MSMYPKSEQRLSPENLESSSDQRLREGGAPIKSLSGNPEFSNSGRGSGVALGEIIAKRISSLIADCIQQVTSSKEHSAIKRSSDGMSDRLQHSQKRPSFHNLDVLEAELEAVHQAACEVITALEDVTP